MKISIQYRRAALSFTDVLVVLVVLVLLAVFFLYPYSRPNLNNANRSVCRSNLKQVELSFRIWAGDNNGKYPNRVSTNDGGTMELGVGSDVFRQFQVLSNELGTPRVVCCPSDFRSYATHFSELQNSNVSYFFGLDVVETNANMMLAGDRNIRNGFDPKRGILELTSNQKIRFTKEIHPELGNILLVSESVREATGEQLRTEIIPNSGLATNRIKLP